MEELVRRRHILRLAEGLAVASAVFGPAFAWPDQPRKRFVAERPL